ncbi:HPF/RaiA family ribosome-associated protein [Paracidovorax valerianellae]|uniref:Sigma 54 modulation protein / S30EA ribosomal protein n=1 Tax=Paracidovorax valerianellae TaxID=187868 RepID=A0A1G6MRR2_9BURK|nr:HPF/RaiA family ribosome-associated protein [Paracidovorax valerianellae]MDA8443948.1 HPF/RaiA family ribosome-associated protein [Paracidovorax valerianellae]SDC57894.1 Sigma 54 modulation protein / S30EA ribosomal protein [Paracidovorax valerianellae]
MEIHINTGNGMENREALERWADGEIRKNLNRFTEGVRRVEVHLSDVNHAKGGADDKRCMIEAHLPQQAPVAVSHHAPTLDEAFRGAEAKLQRALDSALGKLQDHRDRTSIRTQPELLQP